MMVFINYLEEIALDDWITDALNQHGIPYSDYP